MTKKIMLKRIYILALALCGGVFFYDFISPSSTSNPIRITAKSTNPMWGRYDNNSGLGLKSGKLYLTSKNIIMATVVTIVVLIVLFMFSKIFKTNKMVVRMYDKERNTARNENSNRKQRNGEQKTYRCAINLTDISNPNKGAEQKSYATTSVANAVSLKSGHMGSHKMQSHSNKLSLESMLEIDEENDFSQVTKSKSNSSRKRQVISIRKSLIKDLVQTAGDADTNICFTDNEETDTSQDESDEDDLSSATLSESEDHLVLPMHKTHLQPIQSRESVNWGLSNSNNNENENINAASGYFGNLITNHTKLTGGYKSDEDIETSSHAARASIGVGAKNSLAIPENNRRHAPKHKAVNSMETEYGNENDSTKWQSALSTVEESIAESPSNHDGINKKETISMLANNHASK
ncbi:MAG: hypothetical protein AAF900_00610 [Bacteroidota bacterium]